MSDSTLKELRLWKVKAGRASTFSFWVAADSFESAVSTAVEALKEDKTDWKGVGQNDIMSIEVLDLSVRMAVLHREAVDGARSA
jgi:hypothetical protein